VGAGTASWQRSKARGRRSRPSPGPSIDRALRPGASMVLRVRGAVVGVETGALLAGRFSAQVAAEKGQRVVLEAEGDAAGVRPRVYLEGVLDAVAVEHFVQPAAVPP